MPINISNAKRRDAVVALEGVRPKRTFRYRDQNNRPVATRRILKTDIAHELPEIIKHIDLEKRAEDSEMIENMRQMEAVAELLIDEDPEVDIETFGSFLSETSHVYVSADGIVHAIEEYEVIYTPGGDIRERRPRKKEPQNINTDQPLLWSGKFIKKSEAVRRFVFTSKKQLVHVNGLTYDFLYEIAKELAERDSLLLLRSGEKADRPLVLQRGGKLFNGFLEGRIDGDSYCLILHLSNMELKKPEEVND